MLLRKTTNKYQVGRGEGNTHKALELLADQDDTALIIPNIDIIRRHPSLNNLGGEYIPDRGKIVWKNKTSTTVLTSIDHPRLAGYHFKKLVVDELDLFHVKQQNIVRLDDISDEIVLTGNSKKWVDFNLIEYVAESNLIESITSTLEISQSMKAWDYLINKTSLDHETIQEVQKIITENQKDLDPKDKGNYREHNVRVGITIAPDWQMVPHLMVNWLVDYESLDPLEAHIRFEKIHGFADGNGRTGRMLYWWQCVQNGTTPTLFKAENKVEEYYPLFTGGK